MLKKLTKPLLLGIEVKNKKSVFVEIQMEKVWFDKVRDVINKNGVYALSFNQNISTTFLKHMQCKIHRDNEGKAIINKYRQSYSLPNNEMADKQLSEILGLASLDTFIEPKDKIELVEIKIQQSISKQGKKSFYLFCSVSHLEDNGDNQDNEIYENQYATLIED